MSDADHTGDGVVDVDVDIESDRTVVTVSGEQEAAVVVYSVSGERVYLPPERSANDESSPYRPAGGDSPYQGDRRDQSPYGSSRRSDPSVGMTPTADGFRILHPEPVDDFRLLR
jgi:hypothetical protein